MSVIVTYVFIILKVFIIAGVGYLMAYIPRRNKSEKHRIGTIVVDRSDEQTNIFLEIEHDDVAKWEDKKDYLVRVEVRDYISQK